MRIKSCNTLAFLAGVLAVLQAGPVAAQDKGLQALSLRGSAGPLMDLDAPYWKDAPSTKVVMLPQVITTPQNANPAVKELVVRAAHNGQWLAFLIEWEDPTKNDRLVADEFGDQVAVEMPTDYPRHQPSPMMGAPGERVHIIQWRAAFQRDIETGSEPKITDLYPYLHDDVYPDEVLRATDASAYTGAVGVDNPVSRLKRSAVLDQMAEGFGTLTVKPEQQSDGRGVWADGRWRVVITHPMASGDPSDPTLVPGSETLAAFAVWEGGAREVGARKAWSNWVPLKLEASPQ